MGRRIPHCRSHSRLEGSKRRVQAGRPRRHGREARRSRSAEALRRLLARGRSAMARRPPRARPQRARQQRARRRALGRSGTSAAARGGAWAAALSASARSASARRCAAAAGPARLLGGRSARPSAALEPHPGHGARRQPTSWIARLHGGRSSDARRALRRTLLRRPLVRRRRSSARAFGARRSAAACSPRRARRQPAPRPRALPSRCSSCAAQLRRARRSWIARSSAALSRDTRSSSARRSARAAALQRRARPRPVFSGGALFLFARRPARGAVLQRRARAASLDCATPRRACSLEAALRDAPQPQRAPPGTVLGAGRSSLSRASARLGADRGTGGGSTSSAARTSADRRSTVARSAADLSSAHALLAARLSSAPPTLPRTLRAARTPQRRVISVVGLLGYAHVQPDAPLQLTASSADALCSQTRLFSQTRPSARPPLQPDGPMQPDAHFTRRLSAERLSQTRIFDQTRSSASRFLQRALRGQASSSRRRAFPRRLLLGSSFGSDPLVSFAAQRFMRWGDLFVLDVAKNLVVLDLVNFRDAGA